MLNRAYGVEASISAQDLAHRLPTVAAVRCGRGGVEDDAVGDQCRDGGSAAAGAWQEAR